MHFVKRHSILTSILMDCMNHLTEKKLGLEQQHLNGSFDSGFSLTENLFSLETTTSVIIKNLVHMWFMYSKSSKSLVLFRLLKTKVLLNKIKETHEKFKLTLLLKPHYEPYLKSTCEIGKLLTPKLATSFGY